MPGDPSDVLCETEYGVSFPAIVQRNNVYGVQFHPEKSHDNGLAILKNFAHL
jgi:glutamine amidotransferase